MRSQLLVLGVALFVGHGGQPLDTGRAAADRAPRTMPGAGESAADAGRFLAAARGADPVICTLAGAPIGDGWGYHGAPPDPASDAALLEWAFKPSLDERDHMVLEEGIRDADPCVRAMAARLLGAAGSDGTRILTDALDDARADVRRAAVEGLGYAEDAGTLGALLRSLEDEDAGVRATAAWALGRLEMAEAAAPLGRALRDPVSAVRLAAIEALGNLELEASIELLLPVLRDEDPRIRAAAVRAIGETF